MDKTIIIYNSVSCFERILVSQESPSSGDRAQSADIYIMSNGKGLNFYSIPKYCDMYWKACFWSVNAETNMELPW
jgi:hypothetical protein